MRPRRISQELYLTWKSLCQKDEDLGVLRSRIWTGVEKVVLGKLHRQVTPGFVLQG